MLDVAREPHDVDLIIVTVDGPGGLGWHQIRVVRDAMRNPFLERFGIPLSTMVVTTSEWHELDGVIVRERKALW